MNSTYLHHSLRSVAFLACALAWTISIRAAVISIPTVPVGDPGNLADSSLHSGLGNDSTPGTGAGGVSYSYNIGKYDVTLTQYTAFLNTVAASDPNNLYNSNMATDLNVAGISRSGSSGSYSYAVIGDGQRPVTYVSWYDAVRFANWLTNGQTSGGTETGVYTLTGPTTLSGKLPGDHSALVGMGTKWFIPTESEWYKATYYNASATNYYAYPFQSNTAPTANNPTAHNSNSGNFYNGVYAATQSGSLSSQNYLTEVGAYDSTSPYGSYDMGGNVFQWNEASISSSHGPRGGGWLGDSSNLAASHLGNIPPTSENGNLGFRVAELPEPGSLTLFAMGACGFLALAWRRKRVGIRPTT